MRKKMFCLLGIMAVIAAGLTAITYSAGVRGEVPRTTEAEESWQIVTSFYPVYIAVLNITDGVEGVRVDNLTENQTGCLHDYQLTTEDMKKLEKADVLVLNGGGMESFTEKAAQAYPLLPFVYSDRNIAFLPSEAAHSHEEVEEGHSEGGMNPHIWMDISRYIRQVENIAEGLAAMDPLHAEEYGLNAAVYTAELENLKTTYSDTFQKTGSLETIIFHDAFAYLAEVIPLEVVHAVELDGESALSAGEIAEIVDEIKLHDIGFLLAEEQYRTTIADGVAEETDTGVYVLDSLVSGEADKEAYLKGMRTNLLVLEQIFGIGEEKGADGR